MKISVILAIVIVILLLGGAVAYILFGPEPGDPQDYASRQDHLMALETASIIRNTAKAFYWQSYKNTGRGSYPASLDASMFPTGEVPPKNFGIYTWEYEPRTGNVTVTMSSYGRTRLKIKEMFKGLLSPFLARDETEK